MDILWLMSLPAKPFVAAGRSQPEGCRLHRFAPKIEAGPSRLSGQPWASRYRMNSRRFKRVRAPEHSTASLRRASSRGSSINSKTASLRLCRHSSGVRPNPFEASRYFLAKTDTPRAIPMNFGGQLNVHAASIRGGSERCAERLWRLSQGLQQFIPLPQGQSAIGARRSASVETSACTIGGYGGQDGGTRFSPEVKLPPLNYRPGACLTPGLCSLHSPENVFLMKIVADPQHSVRLRGVQCAGRHCSSTPAARSTPRRRARRGPAGPLRDRPSMRRCSTAAR